MKALTFNPTNDTFAIRDLPVPTPGAGAVLVKVAACGLNPVDAKITRWKARIQMRFTEPATAPFRRRDRSGCGPSRQLRRILWHG